MEQLLSFSIVNTFLPLKVHTLHYMSVTCNRYEDSCGYLVSGSSGLLESDVVVLLFVTGPRCRGLVLLLTLANTLMSTPITRLGEVPLELASIASQRLHTWSTCPSIIRLFNILTCNETDSDLLSTTSGIYFPRELKMRTKMRSPLMNSLCSRREI